MVIAIIVAALFVSLSPALYGLTVVYGEWLKLQRMRFEEKLNALVTKHNEIRSDVDFHRDASNATFKALRQDLDKLNEKHVNLSNRVNVGRKAS